MKNIKQLLSIGLVMVMTLFASVQISAMDFDLSSLTDSNRKFYMAFEDNNPMAALQALREGADLSDLNYGYFQNMMSYAISNDEPNIELVEILLKNGPKDRYIYNAHIQQLQGRLHEKGAWYLARRNFDQQALSLFNTYTK